VAVQQDGPGRGDVERQPEERDDEQHRRERRERERLAHREPDHQDEERRRDRHGQQEIEQDRRQRNEQHQHHAHERQRDEQLRGGAERSPRRDRCGRRHAPASARVCAHASTSATSRYRAGGTTPPSGTVRKRSAASQRRATSGTPATCAARSIAVAVAPLPFATTRGALVSPAR
jgi:hypothetical protein